MNKTALYH